MASDKEGAAIPVSGIIGAALIALTLFLQQAELESPRPPEQGQPDKSWRQKIEAPLWQDPIAAVTKFRETERSAASEREQLARSLGLAPSKRLSPLLPPDDQYPKAQIETPTGEPVCSKIARVRALGVLIVGGVTQEDAEMRRRTRYAVISGLMSARYVPEDAESLDYFYVSKTPPQVVPYEWFRRPHVEGKREWLVVLWLNDRYFAEHPLTSMRELMHTISPACEGDGQRSLATTILGPIDSGSLGKIVEDLEQERAADARNEPRMPIEIVSASATARIDIPQVLQDTGSQYYLESRYTKLVRLVRTDDNLARALVDELRIRDPHLPHGRKPVVVIVNEYDTNYARDFVEHMSVAQKSIADMRDEQTLPDTENARGTGGHDYEWKTFSYFRRIDGNEPAAPAANKEDDRERDSDKARTNRYRHSHGSHHVDYLTRMVESIRAYRDDKSDNREIIAIAVFGNDVYDKILIMRALKPAFPKALFLTTDMDARLLDPSERKWTRNLVVATNYHLSLSPSLQFGAPPFRDGYQTATYLAALLIGHNCAIETVRSSDKGLPWLKEPLRFEIGRSSAVPLVTLTADQTSGRFDACNLAPKATEKIAVQPSIAIPAAPLPLIVGFVVLVLGVVLGTRYGLPFTDPLHRLRWAGDPGFRDLRRWGTVEVATATGVAAALLLDVVMKVSGFLFGFAAAVAACVGLAMMQAEGGQTQRKLYLGIALVIPAVYLLFATALPLLARNDEPFTWLEGVSVWPTQIMRLLAACLACFAGWHISSASRRDAERLALQYGLDELQTQKPASRIGRLWREYAHARRRRVAFTIVFTTLYLIFTSAFILTLDALPSTPARGPNNIHAVQTLLAFTVFMSAALLVAVALAYRAFVMGVMRPVADSDIGFPRVEEYRHVHRLPHSGGESNRRFIDRVLAIDLVAERSATLTRFIYFPFAVFALLLIARNSLFDRWDTPAALALLLLLPFLIVIGCVVWLRWETIAFHRKMLRHMLRELIALRGAPDVTDAHIWQFEQLYQRAKSEDRGSFETITLQPLVRALLLPIGGLSGVEVLQRVLLN